MTPQELFDLTQKLYEACILMKGLDENCSEILLSMAEGTLAVLERSAIPEDIKKELEDIKAEILND